MATASKEDSEAVICEARLLNTSNGRRAEYRVQFLICGSVAKVRVQWGPIGSGRLSKKDSVVISSQEAIACYDKAVAAKKLREYQLASGSAKIAGNWVRTQAVQAVFDAIERAGQVKASSSQVSLAIRELAQPLALSVRVGEVTYDEV